MKSLLTLPYLAFCVFLAGSFSSAAVWAQVPFGPQIRIGDKEYVDSPVPQGQGGVNPRIPGISGDGRHGPTRAFPNGSPKQHHGIDLTAPAGTPVKAPVSGWLIPRPNNGNAGNEVRIIDAQGRVHRLMHLEDGSLPPKATYVEAGQAVANVGRTGNVGDKQPAHVHYEVRNQDWNPPASATPSIPVESVYRSDAETKARQYENFINSLPRSEPVNSDHPQSIPSRPRQEPAEDMPRPATQQPDSQPVASDNTESIPAKAARIVSEFIFGKEAQAATRLPGTPARQDNMEPVAQAPSAGGSETANENRARGDESPMTGGSPDSRQQAPGAVELPKSSGHVPRDQSVLVDGEVGDHTPGAAPDATVPSGSVPRAAPSPGDGSSTNTNGSRDSGGNQGYDPPVVRPGAQSNSAQPGISEDEFRRQMNQQRDRFQRAGGNDTSTSGDEATGGSTARENAADSRPAASSPSGDWADSAISRRRYDDQGNRANSRRPRERSSNGSTNSGGSYDEQGNYTDGRVRENRAYNAYDNTSRPIGRYDEVGNRADSPRRQYDDQGYYTDGQTRQNRVYNPYNNTSRPVGSGGSSINRQYQQIQQQSNQRINEIRNGGSNRAPAPSPGAVPFPTAIPSPDYVPNSSTSSSPESNGSGGRIVFDDNAPRRSRFGYDESMPKTPAVTPRPSGTSTRGAAMRLP